MSLHVCFLCNEYPPEPHGGVGSAVQSLGRALVERGVEVTVLGISQHAAGREDDHGVTVIRLPHARRQRTGFAVHGHRIRRALAAIHRQHPIDIVEGPELGLAVLPRRFTPATVLRMHGGHHFFAVTLGERPRPWRSWLERRSFAHADHLCAVSHFVADTTSDLLGLGDRTITVLPNGVDTERFQPTATPADPHRVLFVGTVCEKKGIRQLVDAMPAIVASDPEACLVVAGRDWVGGGGASFTVGLQAALPPSMDGHISFLGAVDHDAIPALLATAAVCAYPSHMEAMPVAWLEAMASGRAVVASSCGPGPEVIEDGVTGLLCDPHDPASIATAVSSLLADPARCARLGAAARRTAVEAFSITELAARNEAYYLSCLTRLDER